MAVNTNIYRNGGNEDLNNFYNASPSLPLSDYFIGVSGRIFLEELECVHLLHGMT